jgi:hypothetical protein
MTKSSRQKQLIHLATTAALAALLIPASLAAAKEPFSYSKEILSYLTVDPEKGMAYGNTDIEIERQSVRIVVVEKRRQTNGDWQTFRLQLDPRTMHPLSWRLTGQMKDKKIDTSIEITKSQVVARVRKVNGEIQILRMKRPNKPFIVVPLLKFYLAKQLEVGSPTSNFELVVLVKGSLHSIEIEVKKVGTKTVKTKAGSFECHHLRVGPVSTLLFAAVPPGDMYLATEGTHPVVVGLGKATHFSPTLRTELVSYSAK